VGKRCEGVYRYFSGISSPFIYKEDDVGSTSCKIKKAEVVVKAAKEFVSCNNKKVESEKMGYYLVLVLLVLILC
jgi:hypothetical protein